jgi:hypothetical protein
LAIHYKTGVPMRRAGFCSKLSDVNQDLQDNYRGAFDGSLGFGSSPALILIDFVEAYFDEQSPLYAGVEDALSAALRVRDAARAAGIPVIYTNVVYQKGGLNGGVFYRKVPALKAFDSGSPLGRWPEGLQPADSELADHHGAYDQRLHSRDLRRYDVIRIHSNCGGRCLR